MKGTYQRSVYAYLIFPHIGGRHLNNYVNIKLSDVMAWMSKTLFPVRFKSLKYFSEEKIPLIRDVVDRGRYRRLHVYGVIYGYLRREGLSLIINDRTGSEEPLSKRLRKNEGLYEYAHMILAEEQNLSFALIERTSFTPTHTQMAYLLTNGFREYCQNHKIHSQNICENITVNLLPLYRPKVEDYLKRRGLTREIKYIAIRADSELYREKMRNLRTDIIESIFSLPMIGKRFKSMFESDDQTIELIKIQSRERGEGLMTIDQLLSIFNILSEAGIVDVMDKFEIKILGDKSSIDLLSSQFKYTVYIKKAVDHEGNTLRMTDTKHALKELENKLREDYGPLLDSATKRYESIT